MTKVQQRAANRAAIRAELEQVDHDTMGLADPDSEELVTVPDGDRGSTTMTIRLPRSVIAELKTLAVKQDTGATVLVRQWITERLAAERVSSGQAVVVFSPSEIADHTVNVERVRVGTPVGKSMGLRDHQRSAAAIAVSDLRLGHKMRVVVLDDGEDEVRHEPTADERATADSSGADGSA